MTIAYALARFESLLYGFRMSPREKVPNHIYLLGFMGAGKSSVAKELSRRLHLPCYDTDEFIEEQAGMSIADIFQKKGEVAFRRLESQVLRQLTQKKRGVVATGGGIVLSLANRKILRKTGTRVYLRASLEAHLKRMVNPASRPLLKGDVSFLYQSRTPLYLESDLVVETEGVGVKEIARWIADYVQLEL